MRSTDNSQPSIAHYQTSTYSCGRQGLFLQEGFHVFAVDSILFLINYLSCHVNFVPFDVVVNTCKCFTLFHITYHSKILKSYKRNDTPWTRAESFGPNSTSKDNSVFDIV